MKQTILSKCFSKMKRVALTLFAALCVGSVWAEEGEVITPEVTPEPDPAPSASALSIDPSAGYVLTGLGELGDQAAVVFTNSAEAANWQVPRTLKNVEILAVGGGGGGGGHFKGSESKYHQGGAGGGGGAVVTGFIKELAADQVVNVTVGAGGAGGAATTSATTGAGAGGNGGNSVLKVGDVTYVTAYGGGGDGGYNSAGVANGGSNSGVRGTKTAANLKSVTVVGAGAEELVSDIVYRANKGGDGYSTSSGYPGAGGGGAGGPGGEAGIWGSSSNGGPCGYGYVSTITGMRVVYGAGGGGGMVKTGGNGTIVESDSAVPLIEGAGKGIPDQAGSDALVNQGGGGGGGSYLCDGGAGGSGIVVLRFGYVTEPISVDVDENILPKISDKVYTGTPLTSGLEDTYAYTVEELGERINFGQQTVRVTLNDGYVWADGDTNKTKEFTWNIIQEVNNWNVEPYISHTAWPQDFTSTVNFKFTAPETSFGVLQAELSKDGAAPQSFSGTLPNEPGLYVLRYWVEGTANWAAKEWTVNFKIYRSEAFAEGYKVYGLGENGDEVAVVFTKSGTWTVPANLKSAQFLVVGGGGGGGADVHDDAASGGAGGGGGGVVTGEIDLTKNAIVAVTVGAGGAGGKLRENQRDGASSGTYYGASKKGGNSIVKVDDTTYVTAYGGGRDQGTTKRDSNSDAWTTSHCNIGGVGGSNGGSRGGKTTAQSNPQKGDVASIAALRNCTTYGNKGGKGCSAEYYGFPSAGGGGGATEAGGDAGNSDAGWPGGKGGEGLASDITGARLVYGSGGGGASHQGSLGGNGGEGAGDGGDRADPQGTSALANQGGGGGGSSRETTYGGNGGSGIVVFRYKVYAAEVNSTPYDTLSEAVTAAASGATITVLNDCTADTACVIANKTVTIDLNGKTVKANDTDAATDGNGVFWVQAGGELTLEDSSEEKTGTVDGNGGNDYKMAIWADGGKVVINAGNYVNENDGAHTQYDLIYAKNGGEIVINGGTFKCDSPRWTLNSHNTKTGTFVVTGGKFYQYNPTDFDTDEAVTTWCDAKYRAEADGEWYVIKEGYTVTTEPEASAVTVTADTEAEALEQVEIKVTAPEGIDAAAYENYFKLVATETAEGSKTWIVALALKDELKPVIAETTAEDTTKEAFVIDADGNVTLNISNKKPGLYYGVQVLKELGADPVAVVPETEAGALVVTVDNIPEGNAAFFRVVVDFKPIAATEAE